MINNVYSEYFFITHLLTVEMTLRVRNKDCLVRGGGWGGGGGAWGGGQSGHAASELTLSYKLSEFTRFQDMIKS